MLAANKQVLCQTSALAPRAESVSDVHNCNQIQNNCHRQTKGNIYLNAIMSTTNCAVRGGWSLHVTFRLTSLSWQKTILVFASHLLFYSMFGQVDRIDLEQLHYIHEDVNSDVNPKF